MILGQERPIRVLVADDSELFRELLSRVVAAEPGFEVVAVAEDGNAAAALAKSLRPDVITMDLNMPDADGFSGIARIMAETPTPILVLTGNREEAVGFRALTLGALDILEKPHATTDLEEYGQLLRSRLRLLAGVKVIRHLRGLRGQRAVERRPTARADLVVIGASLGGPRALATLLRGLPADFAAPVAVVQHIAEGFRDPFSARQVASWILLCVSLVPLAAGTRALRHRGQPSPDRRGDLPLLGFERTTQLVTSGIYRWIRHPMYLSLLLVAWGVFLKRPRGPALALAAAATALLYVTARREEVEDVAYFGEAYRSYMRGTKRFIPIVW